MCEMNVRIALPMFQSRSSQRCQGSKSPTKPRTHKLQKINIDLERYVVSTCHIYATGL